MSLLKRQLVVVPLSLLLGFLVAYSSFKGALRQTAFGAPIHHVGGGYNALGRIQPLNVTAAKAASEADEGKGRKKDDEVVPDYMKVKDLAAAVENATLGVSLDTRAKIDCSAHTKSVGMELTFTVWKDLCCKCTA